MSFTETLSSRASEVDSLLSEYMRGVPRIQGLWEPAAWGLGLNPDTLVSENAGKRVRPALALEFCQALGVPSRMAAKLALGIELFHNFTLVHDDIEDGDSVRRGRPTVWAKYGEPLAINAGGFLHSLSFSVLSELSVAGAGSTLIAPVMAEMADVSWKTHAGQALDMTSRGRPDFTLAAYLRLVSLKTGFCLAFPMVSAGILSGMDRRGIASLRGLGVGCGVIFQVVDDLIDLTPGKAREKTGSDIREGKMSFLVAHALTSAPSDTGLELLGILAKPREETLDSEVDRAMELFSCLGSIEAAKKLISVRSEAVKIGFGRHPEPVWRLGLDLVDYLVSRVF